MYYYQQRISLREIKRLHEQNLIIDAKDGGLLLGPSHKEGGILFLFEYQDCFRVFGEVEGYEYIVNKEQVMKYQSIIHDINKYYTPLEKFEEYLPDSNITIIDAKHPIYKNRSKFIILDVNGGFSIINKYATQKYLNTLEKINQGLF